LRAGGPVARIIGATLVVECGAAVLTVCWRSTCRPGPPSGRLFSVSAVAMPAWLFGAFQSLARFHDGLNLTTIAA
jgi:hypothetical protein